MGRGHGRAERRMVGLPVVEFGEFGGEFVGEAGVTEKAQAGVLEGACGAAAGGGNAGHPVGEGDHAFGDRAAVGFVAVQGAGGESPAQGVAVLDAGVLPWPPAWLCRRAASLARKSRARSAVCRSGSSARRTSSTRSSSEGTISTAPGSRCVVKIRDTAELMYRHKTGIVAERGSLAAACKRIAELSRQAPLSAGLLGAPGASCRSRPLRLPGCL